MFWFKLTTQIVFMTVRKVQIKLHSWTVNSRGRHESSYTNTFFFPDGNNFMQGIIKFISIPELLLKVYGC